MERTSVLGQKRSLPQKEASSSPPADEENDSDNLSSSSSSSSEDDNAAAVEQNDSGDWSSIRSAREMLTLLNRARLYAGKIVNSERVQWFIVILIAINAIMLGIGTFDFVDDNQNVQDAFNVVDKIFLVIFTIELGLQFLYHGWRLFLDGWLIFDLVVITMSWAFESLQIVRAFRIFRALRLVTRIKTMKNLIVAIFGVMPRIAAISLLLFLVFYIFAVMFTALFSDLFEDGFTDWDYYGRLDHTFFTLFQLMTLDNWASIARQTIDAESYAWAPILAFVIITGFIVVNLIIAVICDAIAALNDDQIARFHGTYDETDRENNNEIKPEDTKKRRRRSSGNETLVNGEIIESMENAGGGDDNLNEQIDVLSDKVAALERIQEETQVALMSIAAYVEKKRRD